MFTVAGHGNHITGASGPTGPRAAGVLMAPADLGLAGGLADAGLVLRLVSLSLAPLGLIVPGAIVSPLCRSDRRKADLRDQYGSMIP